MAHRDRKVHKKRGHKTSGWGGRQKHRGAGHRGGRGMAGSTKHRWSWVSKFEPDYFLSIGFKRPKEAIREVNAINAGFVNDKIKELCEAGIVKEDKGKFNINLTDMGYDKLLGSGKVNNPLIITVDSCSKKAKQKIEDAGGKVITSEELEVESAGADEEVKEKKVKEEKVKEGNVKEKKVKEGKIKEKKVKEGKIKEEKVKEGKVKEEVSESVEQ